MAKKRTLVMTPEFRLSFPALFEMREYNEKKSYGLTMLFDKGTDLSQLKAAAKAALDEAFPKGVKNPRTPFLDGDDKVDEWGEGFKGKIYVRASTQFKPQVVDQNRVAIFDADKVYPGCYCRAVVAPYTYDNSGNRGVSFSLEAVQFIRDGERIGGGVSADIFNDGKVQGDAPVASGNDDDPFGF